MEHVPPAAPRVAHNMNVSLAAHFELCKLRVRLRTDEPELWERVASQLSYRPVAYLGAYIDYQLSYQVGHGGDWQDLSCVLLSDGRPVGIWPLTISYRDGQIAVSSQGAPVLPPLFVAGCPAGTLKAQEIACLRLVNSIAREINTPSWLSYVGYAERPDCREWHLSALSMGARASLRHELFVDLRLPLTTIKSKLRKSYRSLVSSGERIWTVDIVGAPGNREIWTEFRQLHATVAGRITRSAASWDLQHAFIASGQAFLVTLRDERKALVGAGYFMCSADEGMYAVAAYDRSLFDKPLGHVVQFQAIQELKRRNCRWYKIGARSYPTDEPTPTEKELSISTFKEGFATHVFPAFAFEHPRVGGNA